MPRYASPGGTEEIGPATAAFGSAVKIAAIRHLRESPGASIAELTRALGVARSTVVDAIDQLEQLGVVSRDPVRADRGRGVVGSFRINEERTSALFVAIGRAMGL